MIQNNPNYYSLEGQYNIPPPPQNGIRGMINTPPPPKPKPEQTTNTLPQPTQPSKKE